MKKLLACTVSALLAASLMASCGDSEEDESSTAATTSASSSSEEDSSEEASSEDESSEEDSSEEDSAEDESAESTDESDAEGDENGDDEDTAEPIDISEMPSYLVNLDNASLTFTTDMDPSTFVHPMEEVEGFTNDESDVELTIEELEGVPMLRCQVLDMNDAGTGYKIPKIQIDMSVLFEGQEEILPDIFTIEIEFITKAVGNFVADDGTESLVPGNFMGAICTQTLSNDVDDLSWNQLSEFGVSEWTSEWAYYGPDEDMFVRPGVFAASGAAFENTTWSQYLTIMRWSIPNQADFYIADITFYDSDGNVLPCSIGGNAIS